MRERTEIVVVDAIAGLGVPDAHVVVQRPTCQRPIARGVPPHLPVRKLAVRTAPVNVEDA